jgi:glutamine synthetase
VSGKVADKKSEVLKLGVTTLPHLPRHFGDRNRTSPLAFTGNKFEFRAVGSSASVAWPITVLNTIVADTLGQIADELDESIGKTPTDAKIRSAAEKVIKRIYKAHSRVIFNGDNYADEWTKEAEKRGLPNIRSSVDAILAMKEKEFASLFSRHNVLTAREYESRRHILLERYNTTLTIEAQTMLSMARTVILPAAMRYQCEVAEAIAATEAAGEICDDETSMLNEIVTSVKTLRAGISSLQQLLDATHRSAEAHGTHIRNAVVPAMETLRKACDDLERVVADDLWPLPTYREMLFVK